MQLSTCLITMINETLISNLKIGVFMKFIITMIILFPTFIIANDKDWIIKSNKIAEEYSRDLGNLYPEEASSIGYSEYDKKGLKLSLDFQMKESLFYNKWIKDLKRRISVEKNNDTKVDLKILLQSIQNRLGAVDIDNNIKSIPYFEGSKWVFLQLQVLINPQSSQDKKNSAVDRFKLYVNGNSIENHEPLLSSFERYTKSKETLFVNVPKYYSLKNEMELYLSESKNYVEGVKELLKQSGRSDWESDFILFQEQVKNYDQFISDDQLKKARTDFKLPKDIYSYILKIRGMPVTPDYLIKVGSRDYKKLYKEFILLANEIAIRNSLKDKDPASVINFLKSKQLSSAEEALEIYKEADDFVTNIIVENKIVTLPVSPLKIRIAGDAESKASPVPHLSPPPLINNKGERPEFVVPSSSTGKLPFDDFSYKEAAYVLTAHEGRPGHDLQFSSMLDNGVSIIRSRYAFNNVNVEGWGLYAEDLIYNYLPLEAKLPAMQMRLWRMARMFLDPEVQTGLADETKVLNLFTKELGVSPVMANLEYRRYSFQDPGQAPAYYYGLIKLKETKSLMKKKLGKKFSEMCFNDAVLSLGLLPMDIIQEELKNNLKCD